MELSPEEKEQEEMHKKDQLEKLFQLVKEQEKICQLLHEQDVLFGSSNSKNENAYEKIETKKDDIKFS